MAGVLIFLLQMASLVLILRAILSWFRLGPQSRLYPVQRVVVRLTEPILAPIRRKLPRMGAIDVSALVVILGINFVLVPLAATL